MSDAVKAVPEIEIEYLGEKLKLVFSLTAFCAFEKETGINALNGETWSEVNITVLSALLWAGLRSHKPEITLQEVRDSMTMPQLLALYKDINTAFNNASASDEKKSEPAAA